MKQRIALLGSTGSIGVQTLDIVRENPEQFEITALVANRNWEQLAAQAIEFDADCVVIGDEQHYTSLKEALATTDVKVYAGAKAMEEVAAASNVDVVVNALVGYAGLLPTVAAVKQGKKIALANKETLVVGGELVMRLAAEHRAPILPVDSEHSAIFSMFGRRAIARASIDPYGKWRSIPRHPDRGFGCDDRRRGTAPPQLVDGCEDHYRLRNDGQ